MATVKELEARVAKLENANRTDPSSDLADRVEDICDFLYGTNVRPPLTKRDGKDYHGPARVNPSNLDDKPDDE